MRTILFILFLFCHLTNIQGQKADRYNYKYYEISAEIREDSICFPKKKRINPWVIQSNSDNNSFFQKKGYLLNELDNDDLCSDTILILHNAGKINFGASNIVAVYSSNKNHFRSYENITGYPKEIKETIYESMKTTPFQYRLLLSAIEFGEIEDLQRFLGQPKTTPPESISILFIHRKSDTLFIAEDYLIYNLSLAESILPYEVIDKWKAKAE